MFMRTDFCWATNHCLCAADQRYRVWHNRHRGSRHGDTEELHEDQRPEERRPEERAAASNIQRRALQECCHEIYPESWSYYVWPVGVYSHYCHDFMHHCRPIVRGDFADFDIANEDDELEEFLGLPRHHSKAEPVHTGAVAEEVGRLQPGKINRGDQKVTILCRHYLISYRYQDDGTYCRQHKLMMKRVYQKLTQQIQLQHKRLARWHRHI